jgi:Flp pilus assembly pilin Flp
MNALKKFFKDQDDLSQFINDQDGASMAEYAVLLAIITAATAGALTAMGGAVTGVVTRVTGYIQ